MFENNSTLTTIERSGFSECQELKTFTIPSNVIDIEVGFLLGSSIEFIDASNNDHFFVDNGLFLSKVNGIALHYWQFCIF